MKCKYCFYADVASLRCTTSYGIMTEATADAIIDSIFLELEPGDRVHFAFQGGEPTLAGLPFFRHFVLSANKRKDVNVTFALQTNGLVLGRPTNCGMNGICQPQLVVEADGSTCPCDFYCLDQYKMGNIAAEPISKLLDSPEAQKFLSRTHTQPELCADCKYRIFCGGGCKRMQKEGMLK